MVRLTDRSDMTSDVYRARKTTTQQHYHLMISDFFLSMLSKNEMDRLCKETNWKHELDTLHPKGMNLKLLYTIK